MITNKRLLEDIANAKSQKQFRTFEIKVIDFIKDDAKTSGFDIIWKQEAFENADYIYRYDLIGFDKENLRKICIEIKTDINRKNILMLVNQFRKIRSNNFGENTYVIVSFNDEKKRLEYFDITSMVNSDEIEIGKNISDALQSGVFSIRGILNKDYIQIIDDKNKMIEKKPNSMKAFLLKIIPPVIGFIFLIVVFVLDLLNIYTLTYERLILIGIIICVCLICFIKEISFKGLALKTIMAKDKIKEK